MGFQGGGRNPLGAAGACNAQVTYGAPAAGRPLCGLASAATGSAGVQKITEGAARHGTTGFAALPGNPVAG